MTTGRRDRFGRPSCSVLPLLFFAGPLSFFLGNNALVLAADRGHTDVVEALLAVDGIDVNHATKVGGTALMLAAEAGHVDTLRVLLAKDGIDAGARREAFNITPMGPNGG